MKRWTCVSVLALLSVGSPAAKPVAGQGDADRCAALSGRAIASDTVIQSAQYRPDGDSIGTTGIETVLFAIPGTAERPPTYSSMSRMPGLGVGSVMLAS